MQGEESEFRMRRSRMALLLGVLIVLIAAVVITNVIAHWSEPSLGLALSYLSVGLLSVYPSLARMWWRIWYPKPAGGRAP